VLRIERIELARHLPQDLIDKRANPRWTPQNRPLIDSSKAAIS